MSNRQAEDEPRAEPWPVKYPAEPPAGEGPRRRGTIPPRWSGSHRATATAGTQVLQKRLVWLLLAVEIGIVVVVGCILLLVLVKLPVGEQGWLGALLDEAGRRLGTSRQGVCLILVAPLPILLLTLGLNVWWFRRMRRRALASREDRAPVEPPADK